MQVMDLIKQRHSVRKYQDIKIEEDKRKELNSYIEKCNKESGMNIQICYDEPKAFENPDVHYGWFVNAKNYVALVGMDEELAGYYGEKIVLKAQQLGLNTCWVVLTYDKEKVNVELKDNEKLICVITIGYGIHNGRERNSKSADEILIVVGEKPVWLDETVQACLLAPTARNQQKFKIICENGLCRIIKSEEAEYNNIDIGIVKCHFDLISTNLSL